MNKKELIIMLVVGIIGGIIGNYVPSGNPPDYRTTTGTGMVDVQSTGASSVYFDSSGYYNHNESWTPENISLDGGSIEELANGTRIHDSNGTTTWDSNNNTICIGNC